MPTRVMPSEREPSISRDMYLTIDAKTAAGKAMFMMILDTLSVKSSLTKCRSCISYPNKIISSIGITPWIDAKKAMVAHPPLV